MFIFINMIVSSSRFVLIPRRDQALLLLRCVVCVVLAWLGLSCCLPFQDASQEMCAKNNRAVRPTDDWYP